MSRAISVLIGPELVLAALSCAVFWFCARHNSGEGRDVEVLEKLVMILPLVLVPLAFATVVVPGARSGWWLARAIVFAYVALGVCAGRIISGFGEGAKGQDAAFIIVILLGTVLVAIASSVTGAMVLAENKPAFAEWFRARKMLGSVLTLLASVPIGLVLGGGVTLVLAAVAGVYSAIRS